MKKVITTIVIFILIMLPKFVSAYGINNYYINATILSNGGLEVEEYFELNGYYNGMNRIIKYKNSNSTIFDENASLYGGSSIHNGNNVKIEEVKSVNINDNFNFNYNNGDIFEKVQTASKGEYGVYIENIIDGGIDTKIFMPSKRNKAFYIKYYLYDMAILHNDIGELGWSIFDYSLNESIKNLKIYINIPNNKNIIKVWAHGPENGESKIISNEKVVASINGLDSNTAIDVRVAFDREVINESNKVTNVDALDKIIKYETNLANISNFKREKEIENAFYSLDNTLSRTNYDNVLFLINEYKSKEKTEEYLNRLYVYKDKVDEYEYNRFKNIISIGNYNSYEITKYYYDNVFDDELKNKIIEERNILKRQLIINEIKKEIIYILISILTIILTYSIINIQKNKNKNIINVEPLYIRDIPKDISIIEAGILVDKKISKEEITAGILDLIRRKIVVIDYSNKNEPILKVDKKYNNYLDNEEDKLFIKMIFENNYSIELKKLQKIDKDKFKIWKNLTIKKLKDKKYVIEENEESIKINVGMFIFCIITLLTPIYFFGLFFFLIYSIKRYKQYIIISIFQIINYILIRNTLLNNHFLYLSLITSVVTIIILYIFSRRIVFNLNIKLTNIGVEKRKQLLGLRNFLNDFSRLNEKEIPEVSLWEEYLVYATAFGIGDKVLNNMKLKNIDNNIYDISIMDNYNDYIVSFSNISNNISYMSKPTLNFVIPESSGSSSGGYFSHSSGSSSSGSGGGGGFSGGSSSGGSFGGGGGGGRF